MFLLLGALLLFNTTRTTRAFFKMCGSERRQPGMNPRAHNRITFENIVTTHHDMSMSAQQPEPSNVLIFAIRGTRRLLDIGRTTAAPEGSFSFAHPLPQPLGVLLEFFHAFPQRFVLNLGLA